MAARCVSALSALLITTAAAPVLTEAAEFPSDSGILNVRDFGARGDGRTDDTDALIKAIDAAGDNTGAAFWRTRVVFLPAGRYLVSRPLTHHYRDGRFASGMILIGEQRDRTIIRLRDRTTSFGNPATPRGIIMTTAKLLDGTPTSGGKDYIGKGEGNDAYENFIEDLTIDAGAGNPGAIGIDYLANNIGAIRNVRVIAGPGNGAIGISMQRKWIGPALLQNVAVQGFETGISVANTEYGVTLDHVELRDARVIALYNDANVVSAAHLKIDAPTAQGIVNASPRGLVVITDSSVRAREPVLNQGAITAYRSQIPSEVTPTSWVLQAGQRQTAKAAFELADAPAAPDDPPSAWVNVLRYATQAHGNDITDALQKAMASGATTIYLPYGQYTITQGIRISPTVHRIVGMNSSITVAGQRDPNFARTSGMLQVDQPGPPLMIERLIFDMTDLGDQLAVEHSGFRDLVLRDLVTAGATLLNRTSPPGGRAFVEDTCCGGIQVSGKAPVIARQFDTEGGGIRIINDGTPLTILGLKTEGNCTVVDARNGAMTTVLGGLLYIVGEAKPSLPAFRNQGGSLMASFVEESFGPESSYRFYVDDVPRRRVIPASDFPARGYGRIVPFLGSSGS